MWMADVKVSPSVAGSSTGVPGVGPAISIRCHGSGTGAPPARITVASPHTAAADTIPAPSHTPREIASSRISRPVRARIQSRPTIPIASWIDNSSTVTCPAKRKPTMAAAATLAT